MFKWNNILAWVYVFVVAFLISGLNSIINLQKALLSRWRRLLKGVNGVPNSDDMTHGHSNSKEQILTRLLNARCICLGELMQPWSSMLQTVDAGMGFLSAIQLYTITPLYAENIWGLTIHNIRAKHRIAKGASSDMGIELSIKGCIPFRPVQEMLQVLSHHSAQILFFRCHTSSLKMADHH